MRNIFFPLILLALLSSCHESKTTEQKTDSIIRKDSVAAKQIMKDSMTTAQTVATVQIPNLTADQIVKDYLCWYNDNYEKLDKLPLIKNNPPSDDTTKYYCVNFQATEQWLAMFKESGFVSDEFLTHWRNYFKKCEKDFQNDHESDGPPSGFDYDFIFQSQDQTPNNAEIQKAAFTQNSVGNKTTIILNFPKYGPISKTLVKSADGKWLLAE